MTRLACDTASNHFAVVAGNGDIEIYDADWRRVHTIPAGLGANDSGKLRFGQSGAILAVENGAPFRRGMASQGTLKLYPVPTDSLASKSKVSILTNTNSLDDIAQKSVDYTLNTLRDNEKWSDDETEAIKADLLRDVKESLSFASIERDILRKECYRGTLPSFGSRPFSNDGKLLFLMAERNLMQAIDIATKNVTYTVSHPELPDDPRSLGGFRNNEAIMWVGQSPNGKYLATSSWDHTAILWDAETGQRLYILTGAENQNWAGIFAKDSTWLAVGSGDRKVHVWSTSTGQKLATIEGFGGWIRSLAISSDGSSLIAGGDQGIIQYVDTTSWTMDWKFRVEQMPDARFPRCPEISNVTYIGKTDRVAFKTGDERLYVLDNKGSQVFRVDPIKGAASKGMGYFGSGDLIILEDRNEMISADSDGVVRVWDMPE